MPAQGRLGDQAECPSDGHGCPGCNHGVIGPATAGSPDVNVNSKPALRVGDPGSHSSCCGSNTWVAAAGSSGVFINGIAAHRLGDQTTHCGGTGTLVEGSGDVFVGEGGGGGGGGGSAGGGAGGAGGGDGGGSSSAYKAGGSNPHHVKGASGGPTKPLSSAVAAGKVQPGFEKMPVVSGLVDTLANVSFEAIIGAASLALGAAAGGLTKLFGGALPKAWLAKYALTSYAIVRGGLLVAEPFIGKYLDKAKWYLKNIWHRILHGWDRTPKDACAPKKNKSKKQKLGNYGSVDHANLTECDISRLPWAQDALHRFRPIVYQFSDDCMPLSFENVLRNSTIDGTKYEENIEDAKRYLMSKLNEKPDARIGIELSPDLAYRGPIHPVTIHARAVSANKDASTVRLEYGMIRGASWMPGPMDGGPEHLGDGETATVVIRRTSSPDDGSGEFKVVGLTTGGHGYYHSCPPDAAAPGTPIPNAIPAEMDPSGTRPSVYVAGGSHMTAPTGGGMREAYNGNAGTSGGAVDVMPTGAAGPLDYDLATSADDFIYKAVFGGTSWSGYGGYAPKDRLVNSTRYSFAGQPATNVGPKG